MIFIVVLLLNFKGIFLSLATFLEDIMHMRKKIYLTMGALFMAAIAANAQSGMVSSGGEATGDGSVSFSMGQVAFVSASGEGGSISQGVQQAYVIKAETGIEIFEIQLTAYPNPTTDVLNLRVDGDFQNVSYTLYNNVSGSLAKGSVNGNEAQIQMGSFVAGVYFLEVKADGKAVKRFKIVKNE